MGTARRRQAAVETKLIQIVLHIIAMYAGENRVTKFFKVQPDSISPKELLGLNAMITAIIVGIRKNITSQPKEGIVVTHSIKLFLRRFFPIAFVSFPIDYSEGSVRRFSSVSAYASSKYPNSGSQ